MKNKKLREKIGKDFEKIFNRKILVIVLILFIIYAVGSIAKSLHSIDTIYNFVVVGNSLGIDPDSITDTGSDFQERPLTDYYISNMSNVPKQIFYIIGICILIGYLIGKDN